MKTVLLTSILGITSVLAGGTLYAASNHLSYDQRIGLETQSPRVHVAKHNNRNNSSEDKVVVNKTTVVAHIPYGQR